MKGWITVTVPDNGQDITTLVNINNITHIKNLGDFATANGSGKTRIYFNTSINSSQRYVPCQESFDVLMALITDAQ